MNIAFFSDSYYPYISGVVKSIDTFRKELIELGHNVYIFAPAYPNSKPEKNIYRFASIPALTNKDFSLAIPISPNLINTIKNNEIDVIHVHSPFLLSRLGANVSKKLKIPLVFTYHTLYNKYVHYVPINKKITTSIVNQISKTFCNKCDMVITPTDTVNKMIKNIGVKTKIVSLPTGIDLSYFRKGDKSWLRNKYNISSDEKVLLYVGRIGKEKNIDFLFNSFKKILNENKNTKLVLVGGGPQLSYYKNLCINMGLGNNVIFTGPLDYNYVVNAYLGSDLFVFASITETQGIVLGEAKAAGLPVVAVNACGVKDMVNNDIDGYLTPLNIDIFTNKTLYLLNNKIQKEKMSKTALKTVNQLTSKYCASKLVKYYEEIKL